MSSLRRRSMRCRREPALLQQIDCCSSYVSPRFAFFFPRSLFLCCPLPKGPRQDRGFLSSQGWVQPSGEPRSGSTHGLPMSAVGLRVAGRPCPWDRRTGKAIPRLPGMSVMCATAKRNSRISAWSNCSVLTPGFCVHMADMGTHRCGASLPCRPSR